MLVNRGAGGPGVTEVLGVLGVLGILGHKGLGGLGLGAVENGSCLEVGLVLGLEVGLGAAHRWGCSWQKGGRGRWGDMDRGLGVLNLW